MMFRNKIVNVLKRRLASANIVSIQFIVVVVADFTTAWLVKTQNEHLRVNVMAICFEPQRGTTRCACVCFLKYCTVLFIDV